MSEEWGPWIEHDGKGCPVHHSIVVHTIDSWGQEEIGPAGDEIYNEDIDSWSWTSPRDSGAGIEIIRYRIRKPRALIELREIIANLPANAPQEATQ